jgi:hypothetical protein
VSSFAISTTFLVTADRSRFFAYDAFDSKYTVSVSVFNEFASKITLSADEGSDEWKVDPPELLAQWAA